MSRDSPARVSSPESLPFPSVATIASTTSKGYGQTWKISGSYPLSVMASRKWGNSDFEAEDTPMARTGNVFLRYYFLEAANSVRRYDATYAAFYAKKYAEATKHAHRRALVLTARKLTRLVFALLRDDRACDPEHVSVLPH